MKLCPLSLHVRKLSEAYASAVSGSSIAVAAVPAGLSLSGVLKIVK